VYVKIYSAEILQKKSSLINLYVELYNYKTFIDQSGLKRTFTVCIVNCTKTITVQLLRFNVLLIINKHTYIHTYIHTLYTLHTYMTFLSEVEPGTYNQICNYNPCTHWLKLI
jgi:hypothetical protein